MAYPYDLINDPNIVEDDKLCFTLMTFDEKYTEIYSQVIKPTIESLGFNCLRADDIYSTNVIMEDVVAHILRARLLIADLTTKNPNVFYELGIAHSKKQNVILLTQEIHDIPFDLKSMRIIVYKQTIAGAEDLKLGLRRTVEFFVEREHIPLERSEIGSFIYEFVASRTLTQINIAGEYGANSKITRASESWVQDRLSSMFSALATEYGMELIELNTSEKRITFPDGYYIVSIGPMESEGGYGEETIECFVSATLHTTLPEGKPLDLLIEGLGNNISIVRILFNNPFDIKAIFVQSRTNNVKVDRLLPDEITYQLNPWDHQGHHILSARNENGAGLLEIKSDKGRIKSPSNLSMQLFYEVVRGEISRDNAHNLLFY